ncbi:gamma-glutamyl-gamma-aminobutyrate hydrolase family protein [Virgibacillus necropolis]|uniref:Gamma-glutamyl-gamma-aminobutyrate hydrolase n=1 Tax=Virgibacillus necropolis TaxID=163877 RepID=A0A221MAA5_9BACI|nr:gamma-glutamyl-gamma-aminobutyrate hydrolase family protein [Virgibacillus necropolis]ASN04586.1 gamma-glutamyl-gamma-aminobutyrate hydrolase [Virgibacillus necropolis]
MKAMIGVTSSMDINEEEYMVASENVNGIVQAGGVPIMLPNLVDEATITQIANSIDGLYATGGGDIDPTLFGEEPHPNLGIIIPSRDIFEVLLMKKMLEMGKPILAICRGCQILNIAVGGDMYQDIYAQIDRDLIQHNQKAPKGHGSHYVTVSEGSLLYQLTGVDTLKVNTMHHQANRKVINPFVVSGKANDGIIEAIESSSHGFVLGLQWHPEKMATTGDEASLKIFKGFVEACGV